MRRFEFVEGTSSKFWQIALAGASFTVTWGKIGTAGQTQTKDWPDEKKARVEHDKLVVEKVKKGYVEVGGAAVDVDAPPPAGDATTSSGTTSSATTSAGTTSSGTSSPTTSSGTTSSATTSAGTTSAVAVLPAAPKAKASRPKAEPAPPPPTDGWVIAANGYAVTLKDGKILARSPKGKELATLPKELKGSDLVEQLEDVAEWLAAHEAECLRTVETWMLRSLPVPRPILAALWADVAWRGVLENAVVQAGNPGGGPGGAGPSCGLLRGVDNARGLGVATLDGDTRWLQAESLAIPHPILLEDLDDWRALLAELGLSQGLSQLFRETFPKPSDLDAAAQRIDKFSGAEFDLLSQAIAVARNLGARVSGGCAIARVWEGGQAVEARYELGEGDPMYETSTGDLWWVDGRQKTLGLGDVGPIAFSEGMRMASLVHAKRKIEESSDDE